jgi:hypothetical protein
MMNRPTGSNVYYLPSLADDSEVRPAERKPRFTKRLRHAWWRLRLAFSEVAAILWRPRRRFATDDYAAPPETHVPPIGRPGRPAGPARVIDFASARLRLRSTAGE